MDSTQRVQFEENNEQGAQSSGAQKNKWTAPKNGLIDLLVAKGYAKNETESSNILLVFTISFVVAAVGVSIFFSNKTPPASLELQRTTQWNNEGHRGLPPPDYRPTLK